MEKKIVVVDDSQTFLMYVGLLVKEAELQDHTGMQRDGMPEAPQTDRA